MKLRLTKTNKIVFAVSIVLLSSILGFLVWRVNQQDQLSPGEGEAGAIPGGCSSNATPAFSDACLNWFAEPGKEEACRDNRSGCCGNFVKSDCVRCLCCNGKWVIGKSLVGCASLCSANGGHGDCDEEPVVQCYCERWDDACGTNCTFPSGVQAEVNAKAAQNCKAYVAMCKISTGDYIIEDYVPSHPCYGKISQCKNPFAQNPCVTPVNACDGGSWVNRPTGNIEYGGSIPFLVRNTDPDGVGTRTAKLCTGIVSKCTAGTNITTSLSGNDISGTLSNLDSETYTLTVEWKDSLGNSGTDCELTTTFTVTEVPTNPDWTVAKDVVGECIDEGTENPSAKLTYTIKVKNVGDGAGSVTSIQDAMLYEGSAFPSGLQPSSINPSGTYSGSKITWSGSSFSSFQEKEYTYEINLSKEYFGLYTNTVTVVVDGDDPQASASIEIDCGMSIPETGIFDSTLGRVGVGIALLLVGAFVYTLPNKVFFFKGKPISYKYRDRFEKKF